MGDKTEEHESGGRDMGEKGDAGAFGGGRMTDRGTESNEGDWMGQK